MHQDSVGTGVGVGVGAGKRLIQTPAGNKGWSQGRRVADGWVGEWHVDVNTLTTTRQHPTTFHNKHHTTTTAITTGSRTLNTGDNAKVRVLLRVLAGLDLEAKLLHIRQRLGAPVEQRVGLPWQSAQSRTGGTRL